MTRRSRSEPVSGANVNPDLRTSDTASARPTENASARSDGQRDRHAAVRELRGQALHERLDLRVVRRRERQEPDLAPSRLRDELLRHLRDVARIELADRPVPVARLAEAAALRAAAHDLEAEAVLHDLDGRDHRLLGVVLGLQHRDPGALRLLGRARVVARDRRDASVLVVGDVVERGDVDALDLREAREEVAPGKTRVRAPRGTRRGTRDDASSASPIRNASKKSAIGSGLACTAAAENDRIRLAPVALPDRDARRDRACSGCSSS